MVLITGGLGYLGARIAKSLIDDNHNIRIATSRINPTVPAELHSSELVIIDLDDLISIDRACKGVKTIIHLAALNSQECKKNPNAAELINSFGTLNILQSAKKNDVSNFLYFSTAHVYGPSLSGKLDEDSPLFPLSPYASSHKVAEDYVLDFNMQGKLNTCVYRLSNVIGSPLDQSANCWMLIANDLCKKIVMNGIATLNANKSIKRDFIPINDVLDSTKFYINNPNTIFDGKIINISNGSSISLEGLCNLILKRASIILKKNITITYKDSTHQNNIKDFFISNSRALDYGLTLNNSLSDEIDSMLLNFQKWFSA